MKFILGRADWRNASRGEENCFLLTNGLGGYCSQSVIGSDTMADHGLLIAAISAPAKRCNMIKRIDEVLYVNGQLYELSSQSYATETDNSAGFKYLEAFCFDSLPVWSFRADGVSVEKRLALQYGQNAIAVSYSISAPEGMSAYLELSPVYGFHEKNDRPTEPINIEQSECRLESNHAADRKNGMLLKLSANEMTLNLITDGEIKFKNPTQIRWYYYSHDSCDGRAAWGSGMRLHSIKSRETDESGHAQISLLYSMDEQWLEEKMSVYRTAEAAADAVISAELNRLKGIEAGCGFKNQAARQLAVSAETFLTKRDSTGGMSIIAGFPFFADWGRDTMIAFYGCTLAIGRRDAAKSILETFMRYCRRGIMPNLFPEGKDEPMYNTVDASLYFINSAWEYISKYDDEDFAYRALPVIESIINWYATGTDYDIHMDEDCLISAGSGNMQLTWMDVCCCGVLPTPRHGKPVEVNAAWYSAVCVLKNLYERLAASKSSHNGENTNDAKTVGLVSLTQGGSERTPKLFDEWDRFDAQARAERLSRLANSIKESFLKKFTKPDGTLFDVLTDESTRSQEQVRCNEVFALSMPFTMIDAPQAEKILAQIDRELYTPIGLRSLSMKDEEFHAVYKGAQFERDMAYHQGTVWTYPLGAYYRARLRYARDKRQEAVRIEKKLYAIEAAMHEGCLGQLAEIYDGEFPAVSKGCYAQAWSVAELLRVYEELERINQ